MINILKIFRSPKGVTRSLRFKLDKDTRVISYIVKHCIDLLSHLIYLLVPLTLSLISAINYNTARYLPKKLTKFLSKQIQMKTSVPNKYLPSFFPHKVLIIFLKHWVLL